MDKETLKEVGSCAVMLVIVFVGMWALSSYASDYEEKAKAERDAQETPQEPEKGVTEFPCVIVDMHSEVRRRISGRTTTSYTVYFVEAEDAYGNRVSFQTGKEYFNAWRQGDSITIVRTVTEREPTFWDRSTTEIEYTLDGKKLDGLRTLPPVTEPVSDNMVQDG